MNTIRLQPISAARAAQRGLSLVTTLLFMVAALMLGVSVLSVNVMQEKTIGNTKDRDLALQAAEAALRDAERDLTTSVTDPDFVFSENCTKGLCIPPSQRVATPLSQPIEQLVDWTWSDTPTDRKYRIYGQATGGAKFPGIKNTDQAQPRYVIEKVGSLGAPVGESMKLGINPASASGTGYRITARATGAREETVVILQSMYTVR
jgi:type IV pilus assembly protein PilX